MLRTHGRTDGYIFIVIWDINTPKYICYTTNKRIYNSSHIPIDVTDFKYHGCLVFYQHIFSKTTKTLNIKTEYFSMLDALRVIPNRKSCANSEAVKPLCGWITMALTAKQKMMLARCLIENLYNTKIVLKMGSAKERRRKDVTSPLIGWAHTQKDYFNTGDRKRRNQCFKVISRGPLSSIQIQSTMMLCWVIWHVHGYNDWDTIYLYNNIGLFSVDKLP